MIQPSSITSPPLSPSCRPRAPRRCLRQSRLCCATCRDTPACRRCHTPPPRHHLQPHRLCTTSTSSRLWRILTEAWMTFLQRKLKKRRQNIHFSTIGGLLWEKESPKPDFTWLRTDFLCHFEFYRTAIFFNQKSNHTSPKFQVSRCQPYRIAKVARQSHEVILSPKLNFVDVAVGAMWNRARNTHLYRQSWVYIPTKRLVVRLVKHHDPYRLMISTMSLKIAGAHPFFINSLSTIGTIEV